MKLVEKNIHECIKTVKPEKIAAAYLGAGTQSLLDVKNLKYLIISPTLGTNPEAVRDFAELFGWQRIYFLDKLHSKIYLGKNSVIIGSANLSLNSNNRLHEACVLSQDTLLLSSAEKLLNNYLIQAKKSYPTSFSKEQKLQQLYRDYSIYCYINKTPIRDCRALTRQHTKYFSLYNWKLDRQFKITWYDSFNLLYNKKKIMAVSDKKSFTEFKKSVKNSIEFSNNEVLKEGEWVLLYNRNTHTKLSWLFIHQIFKKGSENEQHPNIAVQYKSRKSPPVPFLKDKDF